MLSGQDRPKPRPSSTLQTGGTVVPSVRSTLTSSSRVNLPPPTSMSWVSLSTPSMGLAQPPALFNPAYRQWSTSTGRYAIRRMSYKIRWHIMFLHPSCRTLWSSRRIGPPSVLAYRSVRRRSLYQLLASPRGWPTSEMFYQRSPEVMASGSSTGNQVGLEMQALGQAAR